MLKGPKNKTHVAILQMWNLFTIMGQSSTSRYGSMMPSVTSTVTTKIDVTNVRVMIGIFLYHSSGLFPAILKPRYSSFFSKLQRLTIVPILNLTYDLKIFLSEHDDDGTNQDEFQTICVEMNILQNGQRNCFCTHDVYETQIHINPNKAHETHECVATHPLETMTRIFDK